MSQIGLSLPPGAVRMRRADYVVTSANEADLAAADNWLAGDTPSLVICGAPSSGKTHLARIIADAAGDAAVAEIDATGAFDLAPTGGLLLVDGLEGLARPQLLFDTLAQATSRGGRVVLVGRGAPAAWDGGMRDLKTRLEAAPRIEVSPPDEHLLRAVIAKLFRDLQLAVDEKVIEYAAPRIGRSLAAAAAFVALADLAAIEAKSPVTISAARKAIGNLPQADWDA